MLRSRCSEKTSDTALQPQQHISLCVLITGTFKPRLGILVLQLLAFVQQQSGIATIVHQLIGALSHRTAHHFSLRISTQSGKVFPFHANTVEVPTFAISAVEGIEGQSHAALHLSLAS